MPVNDADWYPRGVFLAVVISDVSTFVEQFQHLTRADLRRYNQRIAHNRPFVTRRPYQNVLPLVKGFLVRMGSASGIQTCYVEEHIGGNCNVLNARDFFPTIVNITHISTLVNGHERVLHILCILDKVMHNQTSPWTTSNLPLKHLRGSRIAQKAVRITRYGRKFPRLLTCRLDVHHPLMSASRLLPLIVAHFPLTMMYVHALQVIEQKISGVPNVQGTHGTR
ncbi:hypothetical protein V8E55_000799 [Tylopilus felleus]